MRALLLGLVLCVALCGATLSNTFSTVLGNVSIASPSSGSSDVYYSLTSLGLSFINATNFELALTGAVIAKGYYLPAAPSTCFGYYMFAAPQIISFVYDLSVLSAICRQQTSIQYSLCYACAFFAGTYIPLFDSIDTPMMMAITPGPDTPGLTWGNLARDIRLSCNSTSCGTANNVVPPAPLPQNGSITVWYL